LYICPKWHCSSSPYFWNCNLKVYITWVSLSTEIKLAIISPFLSPRIPYNHFISENSDHIYSMVDGIRRTVIFIHDSSCIMLHLNICCYCIRSWPLENGLTHWFYIVTYNRLTLHSYRCSIDITATRITFLTLVWISFTVY